MGGTEPKGWGAEPNVGDGNGVGEDEEPTGRDEDLWGRNGGEGVSSGAVRDVWGWGQHDRWGHN